MIMPLFQNRIIVRFNPCFNGRGVKTTTDSGQPLFPPFVSILVLMEEALRRYIFWLVPFPIMTGFNPCFNGRGVKT